MTTNKKINKVLDECPEGSNIIVDEYKGITTVVIE